MIIVIVHTDTVFNPESIAVYIQIDSVYIDSVLCNISTMMNYIASQTLIHATSYIQVTLYIATR